MSGNLGNDTAVVKGGSVYGGGGFVYDTSLDGADSINIVGKVSASSLLQGNGDDTFTLGAEIMAPFMAVKELTSSALLPPLPLPAAGLEETRTSCFSAPQQSSIQQFGLT